MIEGIGLFHFVEHYERPIESLASALSASDGIGQTLIVLPEAFNNGRFYEDQPRMAPMFTPGAVLEGLTLLSQQHGNTFVVGLLNPPHSIAVLVSAAGSTLLSYKKTDDRTGNYEPWEGVDPANPVSMDGVCTGVLLCNEVDFAKRWLEPLDKRDDPRKLVCIPACGFRGMSISVPN